jgi:hypothetical protein
MNRETFRKLQPNVRIVINDKHSGSTVGRKGIVSRIVDKTGGVTRIHLDGNKSTTDIHYSKLDLVEEPVLIKKMETTADETIEENDEDSEEVSENKTEAPEVEEKDEAISTPIDPGD